MQRLVRLRVAGCSFDGLCVLLCWAIDKASFQFELSERWENLELRGLHWARCGHVTFDGMLARPHVRRFLLYWRLLLVKYADADGIYPFGFEFVLISRDEVT